MLVQRDYSLAQVREMLVLVRDMPANDSRQRTDAQHAILAVARTGSSRLARIDMKSRGMWQARTVQSGFKESLIAMGNHVITMR